MELSDWMEVRGFSNTHFRLLNALMPPRASLWTCALLTFDRKNFVATIADRYGRRLRQFLSVRLRNVHDVPDVAQEVFLRLLRVERQDVIPKHQAYRFTVASHVLQQQALRRSTDPVFVDITDAFSELADPEGEDPAVKADRAGRMEILERALAQLP